MPEFADAKRQSAPRGTPKGPLHGVTLTDSLVATVAQAWADHETFEPSSMPGRIDIERAHLSVRFVLDALRAEPVEQRMEAMGMTPAPLAYGQGLWEEDPDA